MTASQPELLQAWSWISRFSLILNHLIFIYNQSVCDPGKSTITLRRCLYHTMDLVESCTGDCITTGTTTSMIMDIQIFLNSEPPHFYLQSECLWLFLLQKTPWKLSSHYSYITSQTNDPLTPRLLFNALPSAHTINSYTDIFSCTLSLQRIIICTKDLGHFWLCYIRMLAHLQISAFSMYPEPVWFVDLTRQIPSECIQ